MKLRQNFIDDEIGVILMDEKTVGKPRSKSKTLWFSDTLVVSGIVFFVATLTSPAFSLFLETNIPGWLLPAAMAIIGVIADRLRMVTKEPIAK